MSLQAKPPAYLRNESGALVLLRCTTRYRFLNNCERWKGHMHISYPSFRRKSESRLSEQNGIRAYTGMTESYAMYACGRP